MASIIELIKNIRNARLGKDVRESIASAIEQTYEDATEKGSSNMEVAQARGTFSNLNKRLNNSDSVKANKLEVSASIETERDLRETADSNLQNQINGLASGSPAGVYATVTALTEADPDHSRIYVVSATGHWYYYTNNQWTDGGVYQAVEISTKSIDNVNLKKDYLSSNIIGNLFNKNFVTKGYFIDDYGNAVANANYFYSDFIEIDNTLTYYLLNILNSQCFVCYYDNSLDFISREVFAAVDGQLTIPNNTVYLKISSLITKLDNIYLSTNPIAEYTNQLYKPLGELTEIPIKSCNFINKLPNLIDKNDVIKGKYISYVNGSEYINEGYFATDFIKIKPNTEYELTQSKNAFQLAFYNIEKNYISGNYQEDENAGTMISPEKAQYVRVSALLSYLDTISFKENISSNYNSIEYGYIIPNLKLNEKNLISNVIYIGANEKYTTFKAGIEKATETFDTTVIVRPGTYNLYNEFGGDEFFNNYNDNSPVGIILKNRVKVYFENGAKILFNYTGNNPTVTARFSPLNSGQYGYELYNATVECSNCRYCLHDERYADMSKYKSYIKNSKFTITMSGANPYSHYCIGIGLGHDGDIVVENNYCNTTLLIHNNASQTDTSALSNVIVKDNYFKNGHIRLQHCGASELKTQMLVSNNSIASNIIVEQNQEAYVRDNIEVYQWNNTIHN